MSGHTLTSASHDHGPKAATSRYRDAAYVLLVALSYYAGTRVGFALTGRDMPISTFWPPNAIVLAALVLAPVNLWWKILIGLIPVHFLAQLPSGVPVTTALGWLVGNVSEAVLGAALLVGPAKRQTLFHSLNGVTRFLLCGFILAPLVTSFVDAAIVVETNWGRDYWVLWTTRGLSNMLAELTIVPLIVVAGTTGWSWIRGASRQTCIEAGLLAAAVVLSSLSIFEVEHPLNVGIPALIYLPLPLLLWASMRFGPAGLSASLLTISVVAIHAVMHGRGPFIATSVATSVLSMQVFLCMMGVPLLILTAVTAERRRDALSLREMSRKLIDAQERERQHIARELHEGVAQNLALAELELDRIIDRTPGDPAAPLNQVRDQMTMVSQSLWDLSRGLYPSNLQYLGLVLALTRLCSDLTEETPIQVQCDVDGVPDHLPADVSLCLFRVAQEALQNVVKHSRATKASVRLHAHKDRIHLVITDDGNGFGQSTTAEGLGFASVRERVSAMNGEVEVRSAPGRGTRLEAWVPFRLSSSQFAPKMAVHEN